MQDNIKSILHTIPVTGLEPRLFLPRIKVEVLEGPDKGRSVVVDKGHLSVGKSQDNDLILTDRTVSSQHLVVQRWIHESTSALHHIRRINQSGKPGVYILRDQGSTNGTWVRGVRVREVFLAPDLQVKAGNTWLRFSTEEETLHVTPSREHKLEGMLGATPEMLHMFGVAKRIAQTSNAVLILGETGTGKEGLARAIHNQSSRKDKPFVIIDCAALAPNLVEAELFGFKKGAFTGATTNRKGLLEEANGGTIFLDEIGDFPKSQQPLLLRALESGTIRPVGDNQYKSIDVRVVAATHRNLREEIEAGAFRSDLYYRLATIELEVPPLRERKNDIPLLVEYFLETFQKENKNTVLEGLEECVLQILKRYRWPGNVRELRNVIHGAASKRYTGKIQALDLPSWLQKSTHSPQTTEANTQPLHIYSEERKRVLDQFEREYFSRLLKEHDNNISQAARTANVTRKVIHNAINKHQLRKK